MKVGMVLVLALLVCLAVADIKIYRRRRELNAQVAGLQSKIQQLKDQNAALKENTVRADDNAYVEKIAREELDLQLPGEKVISFVKASGQEADAGAKPPNILQSWLARLGGWFKK